MSTERFSLSDMYEELFEDERPGPAYAQHCRFGNADDVELCRNREILVANLVGWMIDEWMERARRRHTRLNKAHLETYNLLERHARSAYAQFPGDREVRRAKALLNVAREVLGDSTMWTEGDEFATPEQQRLNQRLDKAFASSPAEALAAVLLRYVLDLVAYPRDIEGGWYYRKHVRGAARALGALAGTEALDDLVADFEALAERVAGPYKEDGDTAGCPYQACVARYLQTPIGKGTPETVAARLMALPPGSLGMPLEPSDEQVQIVREGLEFIWRNQQVRKALANLDGPSRANVIEFVRHPKGRQPD